MRERAQKVKRNVQQRKMTRSEGARMIERIRSLLAQKTAPETIEMFLEREFQVKPFKACTGEAHSNAYIDNCGVCAPRWGWCGEEIKLT